MKHRFHYNTDIGQNFLVDRSVVEYIIDRAHASVCDRVLEVGPGDGVLTRALLGTEINSLYTVEVDERLREGLENIASHDARCLCFWGDAVKFDYTALPDVPTKIIANLPYHITTPILWKFFETLVPHGTNYMLLMVQLEAAERIASPEGHRERSPIGIMVEAFGSAKVLRKVMPESFYPKPKVVSAIIEIKIERNTNLANDVTWRVLLARSFTQRRKTLVNNWCASYGNINRDRALEILSLHGLAPTARAEELPLDMWQRLASVPDFAVRENRYVLG